MKKAGQEGVQMGIFASVLHDVSVKRDYEEKSVNNNLL